MFVNIYNPSVNLNTTNYIHNALTTLYVTQILTISAYWEAKLFLLDRVYWAFGGLFGLLWTLQTSLE